MRFIQGESNMNSNLKQNGGFPTILWILATTFGWSVGLLPNLQTIKNPSDFYQTVLILGVNGLLIGLLMGVLQWMVLRHFIKIPKSWITATIFGCLFAEIFGIVFDVGLPLGLLYLHGEGLSGWQFFMQTHFYLVFGGFFVGLFQSIVLSRSLSKFGNRIGLLWVIGTWLGIGLGIFATVYANNYLSNAALPNILFLFLGRIIAGVVLGLTTLILLQIINKNQLPDSFS
jgi:hypothetical protein